jgi:HlyD family secretion protein
MTLECDVRQEPIPKWHARRRTLLLATLLLASLVLAWRTNKLAISRGQGFRISSPAPSAPKAPGLLSGQRVVAEARLVARPGAEVTVSCEVGGRILRMLVTEKAGVRRGDPIAELDAGEQRAAAAEARGRLAEIESDLKLAEARLGRTLKMASSGGASEDELDQRRHDVEAARAKRDTALATLDRLKENLAKFQIRSPIDGTVITRFAHEGQTLQPGERVVTVADLTRTRLEGEVNEFDADRVTVGVAATVTAEGYPGRHWRAKVEEIPDAVTGRQLRPQDAGRPSDTGVLLVKLKLLEPAPFKLGERLEVVIEPRTHAPVADVR